MSEKNNRIAEQAASVKHDKSDLANHPYGKHGTDKFRRRGKAYLSGSYDKALKENLEIRAENERLKKKIEEYKRTMKLCSRSVCLAFRNRPKNET